MLTGTCLCKAISIEVNGELEHPPEACHCQQCRKQSGGFLMGVNIRNSALMIRGEDYVAWYESSREVKRGFCRVCGSTLFWKPELKGYEWVGVSAALFDQPLPEKICKHTFVAEKGNYYTIADGLPQHEGY